MDELSEILVRVSNIRGALINRVVTLEMLMNIFLVKYYCDSKDKEQDLLETVFATNKITYDNKRDTIFALLKKDRFANFAFKKELCDKLQEIGVDRNVFAHYVINISDDGMELFRKGLISFIKFKNYSQAKTYTENEIRSIEDKLNRATDLLHDLIDNYLLATPLQ
jgi:viroplasmin and RNaseH domain-containing protein